MKHILRQVFHSPKFFIGFSIFVGILLIVMVYPLIILDAPLAIVGQGTFFEPGIYVSVYDSLSSTPHTLKLDDAAAKRIASRLKEEDRLGLKKWLVAAGLPEKEIDTTNTAQLLDQWVNNYD